VRSEYITKVICMYDISHLWYVYSSKTETQATQQYNIQEIRKNVFETEKF